MPVECAEYLSEVNISKWDIGYERWKKRVPLSGSIELTERCNNNCIHCFINKPADDKEAKKRELSLKEVKSIIDEIVDAGCLWLLLTGGEPLLREDFLEIYSYAKRKGLLLSLFTNGTLITPEIADYLKKYPPRHIEITIYGATRETFEKVTRTPGSYEATLRGIHLLLDRGVPLSLKTMVLVQNVDELEDMERFAQSLELDDFRFDPVINLRTDGGRRPEKTRLPPEKVVELDMKFPKRMKEWRKFTDKFYGAPRTDGLFICGAGLSSFHINAYGQLSLCIMSRYPTYDLRQRSFKEAWKEFIPRVRALKPGRGYKCAHCELISLCGQCPGWSYLETGRLDEPVEYLCKIAHLRAETLGLERGRDERKKAV